MKRALFFVVLVSVLVFIAGCEKGECKRADQCASREHYTAQCVEKKCVYEQKLADFCGESVCVGSEGKYLVKECVKETQTCSSGIPESKVKLSSLVQELPSFGDKFKITTEFNQPFNVRKDRFKVTVVLAQQAASNSGYNVARAELVGTTADKRTITLGEQEINRPLWAATSEVAIPLILTFATSDFDGQLDNLVLKVYYSFVQSAGSQKITRNEVLQNRYSTLKFVWARSKNPYPCPVCNEKGEYHTGVCNQQTGFCEYSPIQNACGNTVCESGENKCSCSVDCGPCAGDVGMHTRRTCSIENTCVAVLKEGVAITPKSVFDDRNLGLFHLQNTYQYNSPFNTRMDKAVISINLYQLQPQVSGVKIEAIRLLEGAQQIAERVVNKDLSTVGSAVREEITIPAQALPEVDRNMLVAVWYQFVQNNAVQKGSFQKSLEKVTLLTPDS